MHARAQADDERARTRVVVLFAERGERLVDRQSGLEQGRQLARQQRKLRAAQATPAEQQRMRLRLRIRHGRDTRAD